MRCPDAKKKCKTSTIALGLDDVERAADVEMRCDGNGTRTETEPCRRSEMPAELVLRPQQPQPQHLPSRCELSSIAKPYYGERSIPWPLPVKWFALVFQYGGAVGI